MKLLFVGDIHLADRGPKTRTETYAEDILTKLREVGSLARDFEVNAVVLAGDVFHSKVPHRTSHALVQQAIAVFRAFQKPVLCVPGNHDYQGARVEELSRSPLGTVAAAGAVTLFGVPGQESVGVNPPPRFGRLYGVREEEPIEAFVSEDPSDGHDVIVAHSAIFPPGSDPPFEHFKAEEVAARTGVRWVLYGHIHDPHGVYEVNGVTFVNPGSLSRGSLWEADPHRIPQVALLDSVAQAVTLIPLTTARPFEEVFRVTEEYRDRDKDLAAAQFAAELAAASVEVFDVDRVVAVLRSRDDITEAVKARAIALVEQVAH